MATPLLGLALPANGASNWGTTVNTSITSLLDSAVAGTTTLSTDADVTLTNTVEISNQAREAIILWTANGTATRTITGPGTSKTYIVINTSSRQSIVLKASATTGVTILPKERCVVAWDGSDYTKVSMYVSVTPEQFGAKGDGSTDDTTALQSALDSGFDVVLSLGKTYLFTTSLKITTDNQKVSGEGVLKPSGNINGVVIGAEAAVSAGSFIVGKQYTITNLGSTTQGQWNTIAGTSLVTYAVGSMFTAQTTGSGSGSGTAWYACFGNEVSLTFNSAAQTAGKYALFVGNGNRSKVSKLHIYDAGGGLYVTLTNTISVEWMWATLRGPGITYYGNDSQRSDVLNIVFAIISPGPSYYGMNWDGNCNSLTAKYLGIVGGAGGGKGMVIQNTSGSTTTFPAIGRFGQIEIDYPYSHGIEIKSGLDYDFEMPYVLGAGTWPTYPLALQDGILIGPNINNYEVRISGGKSVGNTGFGINATGGIIYLAGNTSLYNNTLGPYNNYLTGNSKIQNRVPRYSVDDEYYMTLSSSNPLLAFNPNSSIAYDRTNKALNVQIANSAGSSAVGAMSFTNTYVNSLLPMYLGSPGGTSGQLRMYGSTSGYLQFNVSATVTNTVYTWPSAAPTGGYFLQTDSSGNLSWQPASGGGGTVTGVTATSPVFSSGGSAPNITVNASSANTSNYLVQRDSSGGFAAGTIDATQYNVANNYYLTMSGANPILVFDGTDYLSYDRTANSYNFQIAGAGTLKLTGTYTQSLVPHVLPQYTVGTLPTGITGATAYVTDALAPAWNSPVTGGGSAVVKVFYNGSAWVAG